MRIKICGITRCLDARVAQQAGADAIGMVYYGPSPRNVADLGLAAEIAQELGPFVTVTGLFVNPGRAFVEEVLSRVSISLLQFHGDESPAFCESFNRPYIKALRMKEGADVSGYMQLYTKAAGFLLDAYKKGIPGGTGESFDWSRVPQNSPRPIVLAGGLSPANIASAVSITQPYGVDVSGGVESSPGIKDKEKISAFIANAKSGAKL
ncbi:phosphoribosylanthranilate isomerase [Alteromonadaceae bacterium Bs31]|nr:phosphoribosylanthranilate isomerase [Alteromonadaceae bacterium Bs31]